MKHRLARLTLIPAALAAGLALSPAPALADAEPEETIDIVSYDIAGSRISGWGSWEHVYDGQIVLRDDDPTLADYSGGSGTLNDGFVSSSHLDNHLIRVVDAPVITLHLAAPARVAEIAILGGSYLNNSHVGALTALSVTIAGQTQSFSTVAFGEQCDAHLCDDRVSLAGSGLDLLMTQTVVLSGFAAGNGSFAATEIVLQAAAVPEAPAALMLALGLAGLAWRRRGAR